MYPHGKEWKPEFGKKRHSGIIQRFSSFRPINKGNATGSENGRNFFQRRFKPYVPAGMFANAKSSLSNVPDEPDEDSPSKHPFVSKSYSASPQRAAKISNVTLRTSLSKTWDFSDISYKDKPSRKSILQPPSPKKLNSEEEIPTIPAPIQNKSIVPWLKKTNSDDESALKPKKKSDRLELTSGFEEAVARFSARLDRRDTIPTLSLQNHTQTTIGEVEKALVAVAVASQKPEAAQKALPVFDLLVERSDWLMFREEFNDETDYPPLDPFFSHDIVSSDFEEYEQEQEAAFDPIYSKELKTENENDKKKDDPNCSFEFLEEESLDVDNREDFFNKDIPSTSSPPRNFSLFHDSESSSSKQKKSTKRSFDESSLTPERSIISKKMNLSDNPLENVPDISTSSDYSPFNYSFLSSSSPPTKPSPGSSKYSFW